MNEPTQPSIWQRSPLVRFFRWLFSWRGIRRILIVLAWAATIIALLYGFENWRGARAWNKARRQLEARGEILDFKALLPQSIPPERNFAATPFVESWFPKMTDFAKLWGDDFGHVGSKVASTTIIEKPARNFIDLVAWKMAFEARSDESAKAQKFSSGKFDRASLAGAAPAVLEGLKTSQDKLAELLTASARPESRYPVEYKLDDPWGIRLPHLANIKGACQRLQLRASAKLALGQTDEALEDIKLMLYLADSLKTDPILISYLVRIACIQITTQPVWEGLADHGWSDAQLRQLQTRLEGYNFLADLDAPLDTERAAGVLTADLLYKRKYRLSWLTDESHGPNIANIELVDILAQLAPRGWYDQEKITYCRLYDGQFTATFDAEKRRIFPAQVIAADRELERECARRWFGSLSSIVQHNLLATLLLPALGRLPVKAAKAQTAVDHALLACALERYRLANGHFPEKLESLTPQFLSRPPADLLSGESYKYRRTANDQFVLYAVGWNEKDDGGVSGKGLYDEKEGDWVWQYPLTP